MASNQSVFNSLNWNADFSLLRNDATDYLKKQKIPQIMRGIMAGLMVLRPSDPFAFAKEKLIEARNVGVESVDWETFVYDHHPYRDPIRRPLIRDGSEYDKEYAEYLAEGKVPPTPARPRSVKSSRPVTGRSSRSARTPRSDTSGNHLEKSEALEDIQRHEEEEMAKLEALATEDKQENEMSSELFKFTEVPPDKTIYTDEEQKLQGLAEEIVDSVVTSSKLDDTVVESTFDVKEDDNAEDMQSSLTELNETMDSFMDLIENIGAEVNTEIETENQEEMSTKSPIIEDPVADKINISDSLDDKTQELDNNIKHDTNQNDEEIDKKSVDSTHDEKSIDSEQKQSDQEESKNEIISQEILDSTEHNNEEESESRTNLIEDWETKNSPRKEDDETPVEEINDDEKEDANNSENINKDKTNETDDGEVEENLPVEGEGDVEEKIPVEGESEVEENLPVEGESEVEEKIPVEGEVEENLPVEGESEVEEKIPVDDEAEENIPVNGEGEENLPVEGEVEENISVEGEDEDEGQIKVNTPDA